MARGDSVIVIEMSLAANRRYLAALAEKRRMYGQKIYRIFVMHGSSCDEAPYDYHLDV
jgi:hypothetical protein